MTSKNSYWKLSKTNLKRRVPYTVLGFILCFIAMPVIAYFQCKSYTYGYYDATSNLILKRVAADVLANGSFLQEIVTAILAVLFAITGNAWNNSQKKNDFYKSLPVKEGTRFVYIHVNSYICFLICFVLNLLLTNAAIAGFKVYDSCFIVANLYSLLIHSLEFVAVYFVAVIAQYLTGNVVLAICGTAILGAAEPVIGMLLEACRSQLYMTYSSVLFDDTELLWKNLTSPVAGALQAHKSVSEKYMDFYVASNYSDIWPGVIKTLVQIIIYVAIAYYIYNRRPAHAGNKNIVFDKTKPFIKCLIMIPAALAFALIVIGQSETVILPVLASVVIAVIILHIILQYAIEGDFMAVKRGFISSAIAGIVVMACVLFFTINAKSYDSYIPDANQVHSISVVTGGEYRYNFYEIDQWHSYIQSVEYFLNDVQVTDKTTINTVLEEIAKNIENDSYYYSRGNYVLYEGAWRDITISYNLVNGRELRTYWIPITSDNNIKLAMYDSEEYRLASNQLEFANNKAYIEQAEKIDMVYCNNGFSDYDMCAIEDKAMQREMLEAVSKDHNARTSETYLNEVPIGYTRIVVPFEEGNDIRIEMSLYPSDVNTIAVLNKMGYNPTGFDKSQIKRMYINGWRFNSGEYIEETVELGEGDEGFGYLIDYVELYSSFADSVLETVSDSKSYEVVLYDAEGRNASGILKQGVDIDKIDSMLKAE